MRRCRLLSTLVSLAFFASACWLPASAQWMFDKLPTAESSAFEVAHKVPPEALFVAGFQLKHQVDLEALCSDLQAATKRSKGAGKELAGIEKHLGMPLSEWVSLFSGRGFLAMVDPKGAAPIDSWILALELDKPREARRWFESRYFTGSEPTTLRGFEVYNLNGTELGFGHRWVFLTRARPTTEALTATLSGAPKSLATEATFQKAQASLTGGQSGLFLYLNEKILRPWLSASLGLSSSAPAIESLGFWEFAVLSLDFAKEEADGFLGYKERSGKVSDAVRRPGRVTAALIDELPGGLSSGWTSDAGWAFQVVKAFSEEIPEVGMFLGFVDPFLREYGNFDVAFVGTMASGSNFLDVTAQFLQFNLLVARRQGQLSACKSNLRNIGTALEMWSTDNSGRYPSSLSSLSPEYLRALPVCPTDGAKPYGYTHGGDGEESFLLSCVGHQHPLLNPEFPKYSSHDGILEEYDEMASSAPVIKAAFEEPSLVVILPVDDVGEAHNLMLNTVELSEENPVDSVSEDGQVTEPVPPKAKNRPPAPRGEGTAQYDVAGGPKGLLDSKSRTLRLAYGPKSSSLLTAPQGHLTKNRLVAESVKWSENSAIYLDYVDLAPLYASGLEALEKAAEAGSEGAAVTADLLKKMRSRVKGLEGSSCLKVTDKGLHFRSQGVVSSQLMGSFVVGTAAFGVPNFVRAKSQGQLSTCKLNLRNIGTASEMWSTDNDGEYPESMSQLVPDYLRTLPTCPAAQADTYSQTYRLIKDEKKGYTYYKVYCKGHHHKGAGLDKDYPSYNGVTGLVENAGDDFSL